jgi:FixJ family two-component response regulator
LRPGHLVFVDARLLGTSGLELRACLRNLNIQLGDFSMSVKGIKAGAIDFFTKPTPIRI